MTADRWKKEKLTLKFDEHDVKKLFQQQLWKLSHETRSSKLSEEEKVKISSNGIGCTRSKGCGHYNFDNVIACATRKNFHPIHGVETFLVLLFSKIMYRIYNFAMYPVANRVMEMVLVNVESHFKELEEAKQTERDVGTLNISDHPTIGRYYETIGSDHPTKT